MYALRITQVAGGREPIIRRIPKRFANRPYQQTASKDATNYLTAFTRAEFRDSDPSGSMTSGRLHWARNTAARRTDWLSISAPSTSMGPCYGGT